MAWIPDRKRSRADSHLLCPHSPSPVSPEDIDECQAGPCHQDAECYNTEGSFTCQCTPGYYGDGFLCTPGTLLPICGLCFAFTHSCVWKGRPGHSSLCWPAEASCNLLKGNTLCESTYLGVLRDLKPLEEPSRSLSAQKHMIALLLSYQRGQNLGARLTGKACWP